MRLPAPNFNDVASCGWCGKQRPVSVRLPDDEPLCRPCFRHLRQETAGFPTCPTCLHRYYLDRCDGMWGFRCFGCGAKFTREMAVSAAVALQQLIPVEAARPLFAPISARPMGKLFSGSPTLGKEVA